MKNCITIWCEMCKSLITNPENCSQKLSAAGTLETPKPKVVLFDTVVVFQLLFPTSLGAVEAQNLFLTGTDLSLSPHV